MALISSVSPPSELTAVKYYYGQRYLVQGGPLVKVQEIHWNQVGRVVG